MIKTARHLFEGKTVNHYELIEKGPPGKPLEEPTFTRVRTQ